MKRFRYIVWLCVLLVSQGIAAGTQLISQDKNWLGGNNTFNTTESNDFWLTFMNIDIFDATKAENRSVPFEMAVMVSAREAMDIVIAAGNSTLTTLSLAAGETKIYEIDRNLASTLYLFTSEQIGYKGVHVYAAQKDKDKYFSCFSYCRKGNSAGSSRDASLILPTRSLGKEYYIQTSPEDSYSTQFAIVATENGTKVHITPSFNTFEDKHQAGQTFDVTLNRGDAYIVISRQHEEEDQSYNLDLSGSTVCADKPIAVFNGNQQTSVPIDPLLATDYTVEHSLSISNWGTEFYLSLLTNTKVNHFRVTAAYVNTNVQVITENGTAGTLSLGAGESSVIDEYIVGIDANEFILKSDYPILCYAYTSSAHKNTKDITVDGKILKDFGYGNAANALLPAWSHRARTMNFATHDLDPQTVRTGVVTPQNFYVFLVTKTTDTGKLSWEDGTSIDASSFHPFAADGSMSYAHIEVENNEKHYHMIESSGEGFVGLVYSLSYAQGYYYTLGYTPDPFGDSLYITNQEVIMSSKSYDLDSLDGHGWYQRQWNEWIEGKERLDTAIVCDSSTVFWTIETPQEKPATSIVWNLYDVTDGKRELISEDGFPYTDNQALTNTKHPYQHQFILPEEDPKRRHPFFEYELEIILHRSPVICQEEELDTLRSVTRVTRIYNDTTWRAICMGDTLKFFNDSLYTQGDLTRYKAGEKEETKFAATKSTETNIPEWQWNVNLGHHIFQRKYESQFGCDSIVTLMLFVCDTFRFVDTIHLCYNQDTLYHDKQYYGPLFTGSKRRTAIPVTQDTSVHFINL